MKDLKKGSRYLQGIKVPEITLMFWVVKILTTGMGETTSDFFATQINPVYAVTITATALALSLAVQFRVKRYVPLLYWLNVVMVSVFGTMAADVFHVGLKVPYLFSTLFYAVLLAVIFFVWFLSEKTLSIHSINTFRRELFYWTTVLITFALGTAGGDMTATTLGWGYWWSGVLFGFLILLPALAFFLFRLEEVSAFWTAYILTRPLGASFADWAGVSHERGGLAWGTGPVSLGLFLLIVLLVGFLTVMERKTKNSAGDK
jgi:uncharacterized membrane-anchored protein